MKANTAPSATPRLLAIGCAVATALIRGLLWLRFRESVLYAPSATGGHDRSLYLQAIQQAAEGRFFPGGAFEYLPLYPWLAGVLTALIGDPLTTAAILGMTCDALTAALIVLFASRLGAHRAAAAAAALLFACYPLAAMFSLLNMPNSLNALGVTAFALAAHRAWDNPRPGRIRDGLGLGALGGVVALGFAGMLLITLIAATAWGVRFRAIRFAAAMLAGLVLPLLPVAIHNTRSEGQPTLLTTHGGFNAYMGNHREATGWPLRVKHFRMTAKDLLEDAHRYAEQQTGKVLRRSESSAWWSGQARAFWREHPVEAMVLTGRKLLLFWNHRDVDDLRILEQVRITDPELLRWPGTPFAAFGFLGLLGLAYARTATIPKSVLLTGMAGIVLFFITARYRLALVPLMAILGAAGIGPWLAALRTNPWRHGLAALGFAVVVGLPFALRDQRPIDYYNAATTLSSHGREEQALRAVTEGLRIAPQFADLHFALGNLRFKQERLPEAIAAYRQALALNPYLQTAAFNLALSLARTGDYCAARDLIVERQQMELPVDARMIALLNDVSAGCAPSPNAANPSP